MNLSEGAMLTIEVRGQEIVPSKQPAWKKLRAAAGSDLVAALAYPRSRSASMKTRVLDS